MTKTRIACLKPTLYLINEIIINNNNDTSIERKIYLNAYIFHPTITARLFSSLGSMPDKYKTNLSNDPRIAIG
jgi:hypothetical protein